MNTSMVAYFSNCNVTACAKEMRYLEFTDVSREVVQVVRFVLSRTLSTADPDTSRKIQKIRVAEPLCIPSVSQEIF